MISLQYGAGLYYLRFAALDAGASAAFARLVDFTTNYRRRMRQAHTSACHTLPYLLLDKLFALILKHLRPLSVSFRLKLCSVTLPVRSVTLPTLSVTLQSRISTLPMISVWNEAGRCQQLAANDAAFARLVKSPIIMAGDRVKHTTAASACQTLPCWLLGKLFALILKHLHLLSVNVHAVSSGGWRRTCECGITLGVAQWELQAGVCACGRRLLYKRARDGPSQSLDVPLVSRVPRPMPDGYG